MERVERKHPRLKTYDYSLPGYYYVTIHVHNPEDRLSNVGRGLAPATASVTLTNLGKIAWWQLMALEKRYDYVRIDKCVVMPTHIHAIIILSDYEEKPVRRASLTDIICAYKSLTTREANQFDNKPGRKLFQTSFYDSVLRNQQAYLACWRYIDENPQKWLLSPEDI